MNPTQQAEAAVTTQAARITGAATAPAKHAPADAPASLPPAIAALSGHWKEYAMEGAELGAFMIAACLFGAILQLPESPVARLFPGGGIRRVLMGIAMALSALAIIYSPWGKQSGAHLNPAVTLTFLRLKKVRGWDALFYVIFQFAGGIAGVLFIGLFIGSQLAQPAVNYVVTVPGKEGTLAAFAVEFLIAFITMTVVLRSSNHPRWSHYTGYFVAILIALYIALTAPISGMSMNPARTTASAVGANVWTAIWLYFTAPPVGMLAAAEIYLHGSGQKSVFCAKLHHHNGRRCIFNCRFGELAAQSSIPLPTSTKQN
ncbi:MAG TPA: aquaporin [Terriglobales bacterium]|nr:aquaporin [Terriglobales bacterium]